MMRIAKVPILFFVTMLIIACQKEEEKIPIYSDKLIGYWIYPQYTDTLITYQRSTNFIDDGYGFAFKESELFLEHKNAGWCGTPPVYYENFEGTWNSEGQNIFITVGYWGGTVKHHWKVIALNDQNLTIALYPSEYIPGNLYQD